MRRRSRALRASALAAALWAAASVGPMAAVAAETPDGAVNAVLDSIVAKQWDRSRSLVCEEKRDEIAARFDLVSAYSSEGVDGQLLVDGLGLTIEDRSVTVLSAIDDTASVAVTGVLRFSLDEAAGRAWVRASQAATGQPTDDATIDQRLGDLVALMDEGIPLSSTVDVVRAGGGWLLCDDLAGDPIAASLDPGASPAPVAGDLCLTMTIEELNAATGLAFVTTTPYDGGCSWDSDLSAEYYNVSLYQEDGELDFLKDVWPDGQDLEIGGRPAWGTQNGTWVDLGDGVLTIMPYLEGAPSTESVDVVAFAQIVGGIVVPRLP